MHSSSIPLLLLAAGSVGFVHSIMPDHWVPLAVVARTQRWSIARTAQTSLLASVGHVLTSIILGGIIAGIGLQFRSTFETNQGHIVGVVLILTGLAFGLWSVSGRGRHHHDRDADYAIASGDAETHSHHSGHSHAHNPSGDDHSLARRLAAIAVPFGAAASPDLTILPVFLAASAVGVGTVIGVLTAFSLVTLLTFVVLTVGATLAGYQVRGEWLEDHGMLITAVVLVGIGVAVYAGL